VAEARGGVADDPLTNHDGMMLGFILATERQMNKYLDEFVVKGVDFSGKMIH